MPSRAILKADAWVDALSPGLRRAEKSPLVHAWWQRETQHDALDLRAFLRLRAEGDALIP